MGFDEEIRVLIAQRIQEAMELIALESLAGMQLNNN
jgi:hypothetical protein